MSSLYQQVIMDHFKAPRHSAAVAEADASVERLNPACGDRVRLRIAAENGRFSVLEHDTAGCAISVASASLLCQELQGKPLQAARESAAIVAALVEQGRAAAEGSSPADPLQALASVHDFPMRRSCALLAWQALLQWLDDADKDKAL